MDPIDGAFPCGDPDVPRIVDRHAAAGVADDRVVDFLLAPIAIDGKDAAASGHRPEAVVAVHRRHIDDVRLEGLVARHGANRPARQPEHPAAAADPQPSVAIFGQGDGDEPDAPAQRRRVVGSERLETVAVEAQQAGLRRKPEIAVAGLDQVGGKRQLDLALRPPRVYPVAVHDERRLLRGDARGGADHQPKHQQGHTEPEAQGHPVPPHHPHRHLPQTLA
ncbi:hypothetical protein OCJ37_10225 [Xanthomonas sp. AM6]|uniref:hypothetical protein n=1 Tax=Xanthomonas sp. AM6 TaxID=2982531 RepID=UPI0021D8C737|nr:hypothetical protein [Xanthomonas sp. AM6]UYB54273.1 hypothetical protein OCJ37_10225 [Xanthomonas sp. AM6]